MADEATHLLALGRDRDRDWDRGWGVYHDPYLHTYLYKGRMKGRKTKHLGVRRGGRPGKKALLGHRHFRGSFLQV